MAQPIRVSSRDVEPQKAPDSGVAPTIAILEVIFGPPAEREFDVTLWDGTFQRGGAPKRVDYSIEIRKRGALRRMLIRPSELSIAEAFVSGDVEIVGNVESAMSIADQIGSRIQSVSRAVALLPKVLALPADDDPHVEKSRYKSAVNLVKPGARRGTDALYLRLLPNGAR
jgi:hypothetical protein